MAEKLAWGIIGAGRIAGNFAEGVVKSRTGRLLAVGSRTQEKADAFANEHNIPRRYVGYDKLLADPDVQAVYIATPHPLHAEWAIRAAEAGKHILCEKPIGINHGQAMAIVEAAAANDVFLMEAYMYRCSPQTAKLVELVRSRIVGDVRVIRATFAFHAGFDPDGRLFNNAMAGGGILDVGGYCTSMVRLIAGAAAGKDGPAEPVDFKGAGHIGATGVDEWAVATAVFPGDILAQLSTGVSLNQDNAVQIFGSKGNILVPWPWIPSREGGATKIIVKVNKEKEPSEVVVKTSEWLYGLEADTVADNLAKRQAAAMSWEDTLGNMKMMDAWRGAFGQVYDAEKPENVGPAANRPLRFAARSKPAMLYGKLPGLDKPVSRLVMGVDNQQGMAHTAAMFDDFFERGGNCFDVAYIYGGGRCETLLGQWVKSRGLRDQVAVITKGAHTPNCDPASLVRQFNESLERLRTDYVDIYMMHRDNPAVPVGEFVDAMDSFRRKGQMRLIGGSNWTLERVEAANAYARSKGIAGLQVLSNNFSLAQMVNPPWNGCLSCSDATWRAWLTRTGMPVLPWSSQARGFFTPRSNPADQSDKDLVRCWYSDDNFRRKERAEELARKLGVPTISIALAYVLNQPFPTFPLIGPRAISETRSSCAGLAVTLTAEQVQWLNLEA
ncbi:MAG: aldo/keto reductase [Phycisphaerae bacterium]|nr:aldo/keto reductase [Phycisphaerae bacterium]